MNIIAECEYCMGIWRLVSSTPPDALEGACMECQADSDVEKPLSFRTPTQHETRIWDGIEDLPTEWLAP